jgi:hypothetical protein
VIARLKLKELSQSVNQWRLRGAAKLAVQRTFLLPATVRFAALTLRFINADVALDLRAVSIARLYSFTHHRFS